MFDPVDPQQSFPSLEEGILQYWKEEDVFKRSMYQRKERISDPLDDAHGNVEKSKSRKGEGTFSFYDGPPFATGLPHYGHLLAGTIKDVIPRYRTMRGCHVERRFGWDCHGLPIENLVEKEENIPDRKAIEEMGIKKFNDLCRATVSRYTKEWEHVVGRMGRFVDMDWDYRTMDPDFMESIWWVFAQLHQKNLITEGFKPMHICPRCATPLSNFEVTQGYRDRSDQSVIITFPLKDDPKTVLLAWTTTPWSLPGHMWLAVGPHIDYARVREGDTEYILAAKLVEKLFKGKEYEVVGSVTAKELEGKRYEALFPYIVDTVIPSTEKAGKPETYGERVFKVIIDDAVEVSDEEGTGIVHITSSLGEDSYNVAKHQSVDILHHIALDGHFMPFVTAFAGMQVKPEGADPAATDKVVIEELKKMKRYFAHFAITHSYPHCWRCDTPLLPYTTSSWFVAIDALKEKMLKNNAKTEWVPGHLRDGRFGKWLENARDWAISRNRYWGTPLPIWKQMDSNGSALPQNDIEVIASRDDLMAKHRIRFTKVTAVRHGESEGNLAPIYQGQLPGTNLTERGIKQAKAAGAFLRTEEVSVIYCSPLARAVQTAKEIGEATGADVIIDERLREVNFGEYEGKTVDFTDLSFVKERRAEKLKSAQSESIYHFPGMETWGSVQDRIAGFLKEVLPRHRSGHVVVVTHADPVINIRHFFTRIDPYKLSHQPYPRYAEPVSFFWDHDREAELDLHRDTVDDVAWPGAATEQSVDVTLVRHGQTDWNRDRICQAQEGDRPLTDLGRTQAAETAKTLKGQLFDAIVTSDLKRAKETAEIIARELGLEIAEEIPLLRERKFGEWVGRPIDDILTEHPLALPDGEFGMHQETPSGGESLSQFLARVGEARTYLLERYAGKNVLVVCHGGVIRTMRALVENLSYAEAAGIVPGNGETTKLTLSPLMRRIPEVLDCWFESGSMPYAQQHFPFRPEHRAQPVELSSGLLTHESHKHDLGIYPFPKGFPADFIAEGIDQTRGWFYTLTVLASALFDEPAFKHCVVNGTVLAEDGKKMSKKLKNYPDPLEVVNRHGADAVRFTLMKSPAVRGEDLRFSEKLVEETVRRVLLPLWNTYAFFVTYANAAGFKPVQTRRHSSHPLDRWIRAETQDLVNRMTAQLEDYDLSATCAELAGTIDALTNWYVRQSRRRFAGRSESDAPASSGDRQIGEQHDTLSTLHDVLITLSQTLAPFCPFITDAIYLNLIPVDHGSIHLSDWPEVRGLTEEEQQLIDRTRVLRIAASLGQRIRSDAKIKVRQPLAKAVIALPPKLRKNLAFSEEDLTLLRQELNVKEIAFSDDPAGLADVIALVDARKAGPRLGKRVQEVINAGKRGEFEEREDGSILILDEVLGPDDARIEYRGKEGTNVGADRGIVVSLDVTETDALRLEGLARDLVRAVQQLRKDAGLQFTDHIALSVSGADDLMATHSELIAQELRADLRSNKGSEQIIDLDDTKVTVRFEKIS